MEQDNYCAAIYKGIYIAKESNNRASVGACCINKTGSPGPVIDFYNDSHLTQQRREFSQGLKPDSCSNCWAKEDRGLVSRRPNSIHFPYDDPTKVELISIHYNVPPLCNAKCITCGSHFSSSWAAEDAKYTNIPAIRTFNEIHNSEPDFNLDYTSLREIYFNGGEPFLSADINQMLSRIKDQLGSLSKLSLIVNTNGSILPSAEDVSLWNECGSIFLICSIDAVAEQFEYIRYPLSWLEVAANIASFEQLFTPPLIISIAPNLGIHNALEYPKLVSWFEQLSSTAKRATYRLTPELTFGLLSFDTVSRPIKDQLLDQLPRSAEFQKLRSFIQNSADGSDLTWYQHLNMIDYRRKLNWTQVFPELSQCWTSRQ